MKKAETIITQISKLEQELYRNYNPRQIINAIDKCAENKKIYYNGCDLISVLYEGACNEQNNPLMYE